MKPARCSSLHKQLGQSLVLALLLFACKAPISKERESELTEARVKYVFNYLAVRGTSGAVLDAMGAFPRHYMLPEEQWDAAYQDAPLVTEEGKQYWPGTALGIALTALNPARDQKILVLGAQDGWAIGVLCQLGAKVTFWDPSARHGANVMKALQQVEFAGYDSSLIYFEQSLEKALADGPFRRIFVGGAMPLLPEEWKAALSPEEGILVLPEGLPGATDLYAYRRNREEFQKTLVGQASFSYLIPGEGMNYGKLFRTPSGKEGQP